MSDPSGSSTAGRHRLALILLLVLAAVVRFWGLRFGLPHPDTRPDEMTLVMTSLGLLFVSLNPGFFHWPSLMFYFVAAVFRAGWEVAHWRGIFRLKFDMFKAASASAAPYLVTTRTLVALLGVLTVWLLYRFTAKILDRTTALVAAFFLAVAFLHVRDSHFGMLDVPMTLLIVAAMTPFAMTWERPGDRRAWIRAGLCAGFAASTKYNGGLVAIVGLASAILAMATVQAAARRAVMVNFSVFTATTAAAFLAGTPFAVLDAGKFLTDLNFDREHLLGGHGVTLQIGWLHHLDFSLWYGLGPPLLIAGVAGMIGLWVVSWRKALLVSTFPLAYYLLIGRGYTVFARYAIPVVPFLCLGAAALVVGVVRRVARPGMAEPAMAMAALLVAAPSIGRDLRFDWLMTQTDTRDLAMQWLDAIRQPDDWVFQMPDGVLYPDLGVPGPRHRVTRDPSGAFTDAAGAPVTPDWIVLADSPLHVYTDPPDGLLARIKQDYTQATMILATRGIEPSGWFDQQDKFFVPMADFSLRDRPGPEIRIFKHR